MKAKDLTVGMKVYISSYAAWESHGYGHEATIVSDKFGYWTYDRIAHEYKMLGYATSRTERGILVERSNGDYSCREIVSLSHIRGEYTTTKARVDTLAGERAEKQRQLEVSREESAMARELLRQQALEDLNIRVRIDAGSIHVDQKKFQAMMAELKRHGWKYTD